MLVEQEALYTKSINRKSLFNNFKGDSYVKKHTLSEIRSD
jgi:hypothetical protein